MEISTDRFTARLARNEAEVAASQRLRYRVFVEELGAEACGADHKNRLETDAFDAHVDHLVLIDQEALDQRPEDYVVGVYRVMDAQAATHAGFYSAPEFDLAPLEGSGRRLLELGRSCLAAEFRGGVALHVIWQGLARYVLERKIEILFGVASFHGTDPAKFDHALSFLRENHLSPPELRPKALPPGAAPMGSLPTDRIDRARAVREIPGLIKSYLRLGGCVGDGVFVDHDFNTTDVCLIMDTARMAEKYRDQLTAGLAGAGG